VRAFAVASADIRGACVAVIAIDHSKDALAGRRFAFHFVAGIHRLADLVLMDTDANAGRIARIDGTEIRVVAVKRLLAAQASRGIARRDHAGAGRTGFFVEHAAGGCVARIDRAEVFVVAFDRHTGNHARGLVARVDGAGVAIIDDDRRVDATSIGIARIDRARVTVIAVDLEVLTTNTILALVDGAEIVVIASASPGNALPEHALIVQCAWVSVLAGQILVDAVASADRIAVIGGALVTVAAFRRAGATDALTVHADIGNCADVVVVAGRCVVGRYAPSVVPADIVGTVIAVVAHKPGITTDALDTRVHRAIGTIVAPLGAVAGLAVGDVLVHAGAVDAAIVNSALVVIIAGTDGARHAGPGHALIPDGAWVVVAAGAAAGHVKTEEHVRVTSVERARIPVIAFLVGRTALALGNLLEHATAGLAAIHGTFIAIVAVGGFLTQITGRHVQASTGRIARIDSALNAVVT